jgi:hypothetical protein
LISYPGGPALPAGRRKITTCEAFLGPHPDKKQPRTVLLGIFASDLRELTFLATKTFFCPQFLNLPAVYVVVILVATSSHNQSINTFKRKKYDA